MPIGNKSFLKVDGREYGGRKKKEENFNATIIYTHIIKI